MSYLTITSSLLWFLFGTIVLSASFSIIPSGSAVATVKTWLIICSMMMMIFSGYLFWSGLKIRKRRAETRMHQSLMSSLMNRKYEIPLIIFATENKVSLSSALKYIDKLVDPFNNKIDINPEGNIVYKSNYGNLTDKMKLQQLRENNNGRK